jgi:hypothetical protein
MDYFQQVVIHYLRANRATFVNTEFCLQLNAADNPDQSGPHWYVDAVAIDFSSEKIFLCEISYAQNLNGLVKRLNAWHADWPRIPKALVRDAQLPDWPVRPWLFVPEKLIADLHRGLAPLIGGPEPRLPVPRITTLEMTQPWRFWSWNRKGEAPKPGSIPVPMRG